jgi:hypothetical protein
VEAWEEEKAEEVGMVAVVVVGMYEPGVRIWMV